ncbi:glycosyltransferase family 4 protein [Phycicoccus sp. BSK3Z-2]|uniref:Glycosyltransferase family 4 protein n=1 Tax=Phycicoccus avicenniae TaxID=2828860 RepID=A0A941D7A2_9MICO|nr:glycosyltransferase family 4 protein [Phycicoccus avicenniae]MBR7742095.1 glycosyltransferase family 4 protein [Phycicoccus avicenniae]
MRVLVVLGTSAGGVGTHVRGLVRRVADAGHHVVVACPREVERTFGLGRWAHVVPLETSDRPHPVRDARAVREIASLSRGADVVHAHGLRAGALAGLALVRSSAPLVTTLHNAPPGGRATAAVYAALERVVAARSDLVLGVSADLVERMRALGARRARLAVVPAPPPRAPARDRHEVHAELGIGSRTALVVVVARLAEQKGLDVLLDAHRELRGVDLLTVVAGDGPLHDRLRRRIHEEDLPVRLLGRRDDVPDLLAAADAVVSSALWEGQPVGLQEALHAGAAIVATEVGGTAAVVGDAALLVPGGDPVSLARGIRDIVLHGVVRDDLRSKAVERADRLPDEDDALADVLEAYASVGAGASPDGRSTG